MVSRGGTVADDKFKEWILQRMAKNYYGRVYSNITFTHDFDFAAIDNRRGFVILLLCADHYLALPNLVCATQTTKNSI